DIRSSVSDTNRITLSGDYALDKQSRRIDGVVEDDDVANLRIADCVVELVDEHAIAVVERWCHADASHLHDPDAVSSDQNHATGGDDQQMKKSDRARPAQPCVHGHASIVWRSGA